MSVNRPPTIVPNAPEPGPRRYRVLFVQRFLRGMKPARPAHYLAIAAGLLIGLLLLVAILSMTAPGWYQPPNPLHRRVKDNANHAQASFLALRNELQNPKLNHITWRITQNEINSLLAVTLENIQQGRRQGHIAGSLASPFVHFANNTIILAIQDKALPLHPVASLAIGVQMLPPQIPARKNAWATITIKSLHIGLLPLPRSLVVHKLSSLLPTLHNSMQQTISVYAGADYARTATPQFMHWLQSILTGKPFPLEIKTRYRTLIISRIVVRGVHIDAQGHRQQPTLTIEFAAG